MKARWFILMLAADTCLPAAPAFAQADSNAVAQRIEIVGATSFPEDKLRGSLGDAVESIQREGVTPATADDAAFFLELFYRRNGYAHALVTPTILPGGKLQLKVDEGLQVHLGQIRFIGGKELPEDKQKEYFLGPTRTRVPEGKGELPFINSDINAGRETLIDYFLSEGFLEVKISPPSITLRDGGRVADVTLRISEGPQYHFGSITFSGVPAIPEEPEHTSWIREHLLFQKPRPDTWKQVQRDIKKLSKDPFTQDTADAMARKVEEFLKRKGYYTAVVTAHAEPRRVSHAAVPVHISAKSGRPYRFGRITVTGTDRLKPAYVENRFRVLQGQLYSPAKIDEVFQNEIKTGLFSSLRVNAQPQPDGTLDLNLTVQEAKAREVGFIAGYGTYDGPIFGVIARDRNIFGTGRPLTFQAIVSGRTLSGELAYRDIHWLESDYTLLLKIAAGTYHTDSYDKVDLGLTGQISRKLIKEIEIAGFLTGRIVHLPSIAVSEANAGPQHYSLASTGITGTFDFRDSPLIPMRGLALNVTTDFTKGSGSGDDFEFLRTTMRLSYYIPVTKNTTLAFGFRLGFLDSFGGTIPIDERFFNGGATTVRSFAERNLGPHDQVTGNPIGSNAYTIMNVEYGFPIVGDLRGAIFYDVGNLTRSLGFQDLRTGIGAGIRYNLPIGPLRIDYGVNPSPKPAEARGALHVSFGIAF
jgi:outer membrane protein assembly complex protein YaeT